jgi:ankyrin repeat protein
MYASYIGHDTIVHLLLEAGVNVNVPTPEGQTPLMLASSCGNESIAYFLLQVSYEGAQTQQPRGFPSHPYRTGSTTGLCVCVCVSVCVCVCVCVCV